MQIKTKTTWQGVKFKDFVKLQRGFDLPQQNRVSGEYPVIASTSIVDHHTAYKVEAPCVTTGRSGALGEVLYVNQKCWPLNTALWVKDFKGNNPYFVYCVLKILHLEQYNSGAGVPTLNRNHLDELVIEIPPSPTQKQIADVLSAYDDLIENNTKRIKILEQMAQAIYKEWFVYFRFPGHEKVKMIDSKTEFGKIPEGWGVKKLGDKINILRGKNITKNTIVPGKVPVVAGGMGPAYFHNKANVEGPAITVSASGANSGYINLYHEDIWA
ncbi:MAG: restriction endonuclease subunit S, partial [bacterium]|nr:restriction endonuclease subunit S [bacterium]